MRGQWTLRQGPCWSWSWSWSQARGVSTAHTTTPLQGRDLGPTQRHAHRTFLARRPGKKKLPLPPLLDPVVIESRARHEQKKEKPTEADLTPFQRRLRANAFAHALASPVRECRYTSTFQPSALLTALHVRPHPTTADPWLLPVALTTRRTQLGPPLRFLTRQLVAAQLGIKKAWEKALYPRILDKLAPGQLGKLVWREDMPALLLALLQNRLVDSLSWNFSFRGRLVPVASPRSVDMDAVDDVSSVLFFGSLHSRADAALDRCETITAELDKWSNYFALSFGKHFDPHARPEVTHKPPYWYGTPLVPRMQPRLQFPELQLPTTLWRGRRVSVYSLADLLGEEKARELVEGPRSQYAQHSCVVMKRVRHNVPVETLLMQLQAYIARPGP